MRGEASTLPVKTRLRAVGDCVRQRRSDIGLSQDELGNLSGLHRTYIGSVERGERNVTIASLIRIAGALQLPPHELLKRAGL
jgi:transcriptional regulator with XRE-family HTH domain